MLSSPITVMEDAPRSATIVVSDNLAGSAMVTACCFSTTPITLPSHQHNSDGIPMHARIRSPISRRSLQFSSSNLVFSLEMSLFFSFTVSVFVFFRSISLSRMLFRYSGSPDPLSAVSSSLDSSLDGWVGTGAGSGSTGFSGNGGSVSRGVIHRRLASAPAERSIRVLSFWVSGRPYSCRGLARQILVPMDHLGHETYRKACTG